MEDLEARPYLQNFCVAPKWRRLGLGRDMLGLAEKAVALKSAEKKGENRRRKEEDEE